MINFLARLSMLANYAGRAGCVKKFVQKEGTAYRTPAGASGPCRTQRPRLGTFFAK